MTLGLNDRRTERINMFPGDDVRFDSLPGAEVDLFANTLRRIKLEVFGVQFQ